MQYSSNNRIEVQCHSAYFHMHSPSNKFRVTRRFDQMGLELINQGNILIANDLRNYINMELYSPLSSYILNFLPALVLDLVPGQEIPYR